MVVQGEFACLNNGFSEALGARHTTTHGRDALARLLSHTALVLQPHAQTGTRMRTGVRFKQTQDAEEKEEKQKGGGGG